ncbi:hypothetical protein FHR90_003106 [Endobacter medicaginis]|uniref:Tc1-like transposase DDE domain-containing protein n=1 Tax=Endobacter medicaginis TaxID=1181271 RepID=A0A839V6R7_9PROT|nr:hypothetical protein [Endobacter medicaginis]
MFAALDIASGFVTGKCYKRHRATEFLDFLKQIDARVPSELDIHIVMDNYAIHKTALVRAWLARRPHYHVHFAPTSAPSSTIITTTRNHTAGPNPPMKTSLPSSASARLLSEPYAANFRFI